MKRFDGIKSVSRLAAMFMLLNGHIFLLLRLSLSICCFILFIGLFIFASCFFMLPFRTIFGLF